MTEILIVTNNSDVNYGDNLSKIVRHLDDSYLCTLIHDVDVEHNKEHIERSEQIYDFTGCFNPGENFRCSGTNTYQMGTGFYTCDLYIRRTEHGIMEGIKLALISNTGEQKYLDALIDIRENGEESENRTGVNTIFMFDVNLKFTMTEVDQNTVMIPLFTTRKIYFRGVIGELLWFLKGLTNSKWLEDRKINIWKGNTSREALDKVGLDYEEGELGPGYGHQWVNWGGDFRTGTGGINQIEEIIRILNYDPTNRRIVLSAWNVSDLCHMALPPCHILYMFTVTNLHGDIPTLNCKVVLRSNDMFHGCPFNVASASLLTFIISRCVCMNVGKISLSIANAHIYKTHLELVDIQTTRKPLVPPTVRIKKRISTYNDIKNLEIEDFELDGYNCHERLNAEMVA